jgi:hypothetical protein
MHETVISKEKMAEYSEKCDSAAAACRLRVLGDAYSAADSCDLSGFLRFEPRRVIFPASRPHPGKMFFLIASVDP